MAKTGTINRFEELIAWQKSRELANLVYRHSNVGGFSKDFSLKNQMCKASISIMSNIAEGFEKYSAKDFQNYLAIARGSAAEVRSQAYLARDQEYLTEQQFTEMIDLCNEIGRILAGLRRSLSKKK
jgi:four helix bundle protein